MPVKKKASDEPKVLSQEEKDEAEIVRQAYLGNLVPATLETLVGPDDLLEDLP